MQRRSYYPHNQHLISTATATSSGLASSRPATPANDLKSDSVGIHGNDYVDDSIRDKDSIRLDRMNGDLKDQSVGLLCFRSKRTCSFVTMLK